MLIVFKIISWILNNRNKNDEETNIFVYFELLSFSIFESDFIFKNAIILKIKQLWAFKYYVLCLVKESEQIEHKKKEN